MLNVIVSRNVEECDKIMLLLLLLFMDFIFYIMIIIFK